MAYANGPALRVLQGKSDVALDALLAKVNLAASNFRNLFPNDDEPEVGMRYRNEKRHFKFKDLQTELLIPTIEHGRKFALSFYYGKILAAIHGVTQTRATYKITDDDGPKVTAYIVHRGQHCQEVSTWRKADNQNVQMTKDSREYREVYKMAFEAARVSNEMRPPWVSEITFNVLRSLKVPCARLDREQYDTTFATAREEFSRYYYNTNKHTIIDFFRAARNFASKSRFSKPAGNKNSSYGGGPRSSAYDLRR
jgi:hypothetical protein